MGNRPRKTGQIADRVVIGTSGRLSICTPKSPRIVFTSVVCVSALNSMEMTQRGRPRLFEGDRYLAPDGLPPAAEAEHRGTGPARCWIGRPPPRNSFWWGRVQTQDRFPASSASFTSAWFRLFGLARDLAPRLQRSRQAGHGVIGQSQTPPRLPIKPSHHAYGKVRPQQGCACCRTIEIGRQLAIGYSLVQPRSKSKASTSPRRWRTNTRPAPGMAPPSSTVLMRRQPQ